MNNPLSSPYSFQLNGASMYPGASFVYLSPDGKVPYYNVDELAELLVSYGHDATAQALLTALKPADVFQIADGRYLKTATLAALGINTEVDTNLNSQTLVAFTIK